MMKTKAAVAILVAAALTGSTFAAEAKSHKQSKHHASMTSGAHMKSDKSGNMGSGANHGATAPSDPGSATNGNGASGM
jgi:hypothetical protein